MGYSRKEFLKSVGKTALAGTILTGLPRQLMAGAYGEELFFDISLAEWSLNELLFSGELDHLDFPRVAKEEFGITAVEYVNQFFMDKAEDIDYLDQMNKVCGKLGVEQLIIMVDDEGDLGSPDPDERDQAIDNHKKWVDAAAYLGCHSIRVNAHEVKYDTDPEKIADYSVDGIRGLCDYAKPRKINIIIENHGGWSSDGEWLVNVIKRVDRDNCGSLPDFGNNCIVGDDAGDCEQEMDRYRNTELLMPYAEGVSAKSFNFNAKGEETEIDYERMLKIVKEHGYTGYIGVEYEGDDLHPYEGVRMTKKLLEKTGKKLTK